MASQGLDLLVDVLLAGVLGGGVLVLLRHVSLIALKYVKKETYMSKREEMLDADNLTYYKARP